MSVGASVAIGTAVSVAVGEGVGIPVAEGAGLGVKVGGINGVNEGDRIRPTTTVACGVIGPRVAADVAVANEILPDGASANAATPTQ